MQKDATLEKSIIDQIDIKETLNRLKSINTCGWQSHRASIYVGFYSGPLTTDYTRREVDISASNSKKNNRDFATLLIHLFLTHRQIQLVKLINSTNVINHTHLYHLCKITEINQEITRIKKQAKAILDSIQPDKKQIKKLEMKKEIIFFLKFLPDKYKFSKADLSEVLSEIADEYLVKTVMDL